MFNNGFFSYSGNPLADNEVFNAGHNTWRIT